MNPADEDRLLAEQKAFYRHRAPEYDEWWQRRGHYDHGPEEAEEWRREVETVRSALDDFAPTGDVLELAGGTGWWTQRLAETAGTLTVLDASSEVLARNRIRVGRPEVRYIVADVFDWSAPARFDVVFFSFWLSHVPRTRFPEFWKSVASRLRPGGRVFLIDNRWDAGRLAPDPYVVDSGPDVQRRRLSDGSEHRVVKVFYEPAELASLLVGEGWIAEIDGTRWFIFGRATLQSMSKEPPARQ